MIAKLLFFLISFVLAGSHFPRPSSKILATFNEKIVSGDIDALKSIIDSNPKFVKSSFAKQYRNKGFILAVQRGHVPVVEFLLKNANVNAATRNNEAFLLALANGNVDIVRLLLNRPEINPGIMYYDPLIEATRSGYTEMVRLLLSHPKIDPTISGRQAAVLASIMSHLDILKLFIYDQRVNPSIFHMHNLEQAAQLGKVDMARFYLVYPAFNRLAHLVVITGDLLTIKTLVKAGYKIDEETLERTLNYARSRGKYDVVEYVQSLKEKPKPPTRPLNSKTEQCAICLADDNLLEGYITSCKHVFHLECLQQWIANHNSCPMCRSSLI